MTERVELFALEQGETFKDHRPRCICLNVFMLKTRVKIPFEFGVAEVLNAFGEDHPGGDLILQVEGVFGRLNSSEDASFLEVDARSGDFREEEEQVRVKPNEEVREGDRSSALTKRPSEAPEGEESPL
ncbi:hypothetical protein ACLOJK_037328 [Asimina triloba]